MKKNIRPVIFSLIFFLLLLAQAGCAADSPNARYVFLFIGDGMGPIHVDAANAYLKAVNKADSKKTSLAMTDLPVQSVCTTHAFDGSVTDSAASGTALACGKKTSNGTISMNPEHTKAYTTIAEQAHAAGFKVGILSTAPIDHATPAVFYAHQSSRNKFHEISMDLARSDFDYFAGAGLEKPQKKNIKDEVIEDASQLAKDNGYLFVNTPSQLQKINPGQKVIARIKKPATGLSMDDKTDRSDQLGLVECTRQAIRLLENSKGFFMMIEGAKIDWGSHANDLPWAIRETIEFDQSIQVALAFYEKHPEDTLIIITADHECGGLKKFDTGRIAPDMRSLEKQKRSAKAFISGPLAEYKAGTAWSTPADDMDPEIKNLIEADFGIVYKDLTDTQKQQIEEAYDLSMDSFRNRSKEEKPLYSSSHDPLAAASMRLMAQKTGFSWTSGDHTGVPVPVFSIGCYSELFKTPCDNTDIPKHIAKTMNLSLDN